MPAANHNLRVLVWDLGPSDPKVPKRPELPNAKPDTPEAIMAESDFRAAMAIYEGERDAYARLKREFDAWHRQNGGPYQLEMWSMDVADALVRDPDRYVLKLPKGKKPGRRQHEIEAQRRQEQSDLDVMRERDPQFGRSGVAA